MQLYENTSLILKNAGGTNSGEVQWQCPSNIALIKYWGKHGLQLPKNPSISFTLSNAHTITRIVFAPKKDKKKGISLRFFFDDQPKPAFHPKIIKFIERLEKVFPFLMELELEVYSSNSFPHSAGIASSASSMGALALCFCSMAEQLFEEDLTTAAFFKRASFIARLGSGSASRSIFPYAAIWGTHHEVDGSSDLFSVPFEEGLHEVFKSFRDDILIVSKSEKSVSSTLGHALMDTNIFAEQRFLQAGRNLSTILPVLKAGDLETFGEITESEALALHALMMTSQPGFILMEPNTLEAIKRIRAFRKETNLPVYFTLDAGPNIHLLYPENIQETVQRFKEDQLRELCQDGKIINDEVGKGPEKQDL